jgi:hypothetical protein
VVAGNVPGTLVSWVAASAACCLVGDCRLASDGRIDARLLRPVRRGRPSRRRRVGGNGILPCGRDRADAAVPFRDHASESARSVGHHGSDSCWEDRGCCFQLDVVARSDPSYVLYYSVLG